MNTSSSSLSTLPLPLPPVERSTSPLRKCARPANGQFVGSASHRGGGARTALRAGQQGIALVVALVLLIVITLVGLAAVRGTLMQQRMAANQFDRQVAFQSAEAAMRAATQLIATNPAIIARNCQAASVVCPANPFDDPNLAASSINTVAEGTAAGQFTRSTVAAGQPQYVVENMGNWHDPNTNTGFNNTANAAQYGAQGASTTAIYYRVTARSGDPAVVGDRAVVVLQAMIKRS